ncbi:hypothetical protein ACLOJK_039454 [Asimina triloba]
MADFTAPSFSLGLDSDQEEESQSLPGRAAASPIDISSQSPKEDDEDDGHFNAEALDPDPVPRRALKRLRRGLPPPLSGIKERESPKRPSNADDDEEIEEFSSPEDPQKANTSNARKKKPTETASTSASIEASCNKGIFPRLTISPLRKFRLLDSDTDEPSGEIKHESTKKANAFAKDTSFTPQKPIDGTQNKGAKCSSSVPQAECLWKDFSPVKNKKMKTPALDEFCEDFFRSMKDSSARNSMGGDMRASFPNPSLDETVDCFPSRSNGESVKKSRKKHENSLSAYQYFYHNDPRIRKLVHNRLPNFFPIGPVNQEGQLDYMSQFGQTDVSVKASARPHETGNKDLGGSLQERKKKLNNTSAQEVSQVSGSWMNPKSSATIPRDAGKRRVHADVSSSGHWYTAPDGRKACMNTEFTKYQLEQINWMTQSSVFNHITERMENQVTHYTPTFERNGHVYVSKNGQELVGRMAYRQHRKGEMKVACA